MGRPIIIAHRGASGYLPEHTLESAAFAHALRADYVEQDVVMSKDDVLVVLHDIHLDTTTDVATRHPDCARADGRFYAVDFTWSELRALRVRERFDPNTGRPVFPQRFADASASFRLCTMEEQLRLIRGLNASTGRNVGVYPEIKAPAWHAGEGKDPGRALLTLLHEHGYGHRGDRAIVQCFDPHELQRLRPHTDLTFVLLLDAPIAPENTSPPPAPKWAEIATFAQGIGPHLSGLAELGPGGIRRVHPLADEAHAAGLFVHAYTFRADQLPPEVPDLPAFVQQFHTATRLDGIFVDHPDQVM